MTIRNSDFIDEQIIKMRSQRCGIFVIFKWVEKWSDFQNLDKIIVLIHIFKI